MRVDHEVGEVQLVETRLDRLGCGHPHVRLELVLPPGDGEHLFGHRAHHDVDLEPLRGVREVGDQLVRFGRGRDDGVLGGEEESGGERVGVGGDGEHAERGQVANHRDSGSTTGTGDEHATPDHATTSGSAPGVTGAGIRGPPMSDRRVNAAGNASTSTP